MRQCLSTLLLSVLIGQCTQLYAAYEPVGSNADWLSSGDGDGYEEGSGPDDDNYVYLYEGSGRDAVADLTRCEQLRAAMSNYEGAYQPQCDENGEFAPMQCNDATGECWCVRPNGQDIPGTITREPHRPVCSREDIPVEHDDGSDIYIDTSHTTTVRPVRHYPTSTAAFDDRDDDGTEVEKLPSSDLRALILSEPLFLAGLIGGAVLILLLIILILMFVVYRMRKKDEGSYSLDEPRHYSFNYTRAKDQEFFA